MNPEMLVGPLGIALVLFLGVLALFWLIFPWMVYYKLTKMVEKLTVLEKVQNDAALVQRNFMSDAREWMKNVEQTR